MKYEIYIIFDKFETIWDRSGHPNVGYGNLYLLDTDSTFQEKFHVVSGGWGRGCLPAGDYSGKYLDVRTDPRFFLNGFGWSLYLEPHFKTTRSELMIHPDGNIEGTLGCVGITDHNHKSLYNHLKEYFTKEHTNFVKVYIYHEKDKIPDDVNLIS